MHQYAAGRSDALDDARIAELIGAVRSALDEGRAAEAPSVPGKRPYVKEGAVPLAPKDAESCRRCGRCVEACPVEAVDAMTLKTDKGTCIACMGCVAVCPDRARTVNGLLVKAAALKVAAAPQMVVESPQTMGAEDFADYTLQTKASFAMLGGGGSYPQHSDHFVIEEEAFPVGVALYAQVAADFLNQ